MSKQNWQNYLLLSIATLVWSSAFVGIRFGLRDYSPGAMALMRFSVASLTILPLYWHARQSDKQITAKDRLKIFFTGFIGISLYHVALNYGETSVSSGTASFIVSQAPVLVLILAVVFLKERPGIMGWVGFLISCLGVAIIAFAENASMHVSWGLILLGLAAVASAYYTILQKSLLSKINAIELMALLIWSGTLGMAMFLPDLVHDFQHASFSSSLVVVYLGVFPGVIAYTCWTIVLARMPAAHVISWVYLQPILATVLGWLLVNEVPVVFSVVGGCIALLGALIVQFWGKRQQSNA